MKMRPRSEVAFLVSSSVARRDIEIIEAGRRRAGKARGRAKH